MGKFARVEIHVARMKQPTKQKEKMNVNVCPVKGFSFIY